MGEPFRDDLSAALAHAEHLADENRSLRVEIEHLRAGYAPPTLPVKGRDEVKVPPAPEPTKAPPESVRERVLEELERLSSDIDVHAEQVAARAPPEPVAPPVAPEPPPRRVSPRASPAPRTAVEPHAEPTYMELPASPIVLPVDIPAELATATDEALALKRKLVEAKTWAAIAAGVGFFVGLIVGWWMGR